MWHVPRVYRKAQSRHFYWHNYLDSKETHELLHLWLFFPSRCHSPDVSSFLAPRGSIISDNTVCWKIMVPILFYRMQHYCVTLSDYDVMGLNLVTSL